MGKRILSLGLVTGLLSSLLLIGGCLPAGEGEEGATFDWTFIAILVGIMVIFYFLMIRPQQRKQKDHQKLMMEIKRGDNVVTIGGIYGRVESVSDDSLIIKVESGATMRVSRSSISNKTEGYK